MTVVTSEINIKTTANGGMVDLTIQVQKCVADSKLTNGIVVLFCPGSTGALSTVEYEPGLQQDIPKALDRLAPKTEPYTHHETWGDDNGPGHVKATILGPDLTVPFVNKKLTLGTWQQIVFIECDTRNRNRKIIVQIIGE